MGRKQRVTKAVVACSEDLSEDSERMVAHAPKKGSLKDPYTMLSDDDSDGLNGLINYDDSDDEEDEEEIASENGALSGSSSSSETTEPQRLTHQAIKQRELLSLIEERGLPIETIINAVAAMNKTTSDSHITSMLQMPPPPPSVTTASVYPSNSANAMLPAFRFTRGNVTSWEHVFFLEERGERVQTAMKGYTMPTELNEEATKDLFGLVAANHRICYDIIYELARHEKNWSVLARVLTTLFSMDEPTLTMRSIVADNEGEIPDDTDVVMRRFLHGVECARVLKMCFDRSMLRPGTLTHSAVTKQRAFQPESFCIVCAGRFRNNKGKAPMYMRLGCGCGYVHRDCIIEYTYRSNSHCPLCTHDLKMEPLRSQEPGNKAPVLNGQIVSRREMATERARDHLCSETRERKRICSNPFCKKPALETSSRVVAFRCCVDKARYHHNCLRDIICGARTVMCPRATAGAHEVGTPGSSTVYTVDTSKMRTGGRKRSRENGTKKLKKKDRLRKAVVNERVKKRPKVTVVAEPAVTKILPKKKKKTRPQPRARSVEDLVKNFMKTTAIKRK